MANFTLTLKTTDEKIYDMIVYQCNQKLREWLKGANFEKTIVNIVTYAIAKAIKDSPTYKSLVYPEGRGGLKYELGVVDAESTILDIISIFSKNIKVKSTLRRTGLIINCNITMKMNTAFNDILSAYGASFESEHGYEIPWLKWLLTLGNQIIIKEYEIKYGKNNASRTGMAIMVNKKNSQGWCVPPEFAGTETDNFLTKALINVEKSNELENAFILALR